MSKLQKKQESAADWQRVVSNLRQYMPKDQETKEAQELGQLFSTAARAGGGGTKAGLVGRRPLGLQKASEFVDRMTPGKMAPPKRMFEDPIKEPQKGRYVDIEARIRISLPRSFCPECDRTDRPMGPTAGGCWNISPYTEDRVDLHLKANELIESFRCDECLMKQRAKLDQSNFDRASALQLATVSGIESNQERRVNEDYSKILLQIKKNTEAYIQWAILAGHDTGRDDDIFIQYPGEDRWK